MHNLSITGLMLKIKLGWRRESIISDIGYINNNFNQMSKYVLYHIHQNEG